MSPVDFWMGYLLCALVLGACQWVNEATERGLRMRAARRRVSRLVCE
ncbi:hypothetical protein [Variovorax sp.]|nr:hypothetical protein [Variovorax sp.]HYP84394.1 hypothetical protein [Variovorax sp.]